MLKNWQKSQRGRIRFGGTRIQDDLKYAAQTWPRAFRVVLKAEVMALGDTPRFVVTSLDLPSPESLYRDLY